MNGHTVRGGSRSIWRDNTENERIVQTSLEVERLGTRLLGRPFIT